MQQVTTDNEWVQLTFIRTLYSISLNSLPGYRNYPMFSDANK